ncbi:hypothetical protein PAXRUDRAFT_832418 [Paxillus rubicundulus Ve08.2h10]|uniref:Translation initiation factor IF-2, mitochondrial n=1 Tax=Paxillus rubicundulus Ve08.2h10 TaxID=930991 RepID=A0A0D0DK75_9AGAM|nr:hypothetical protein PAXRUDRAFT_832418 [Paxillus rubicundulus Ve08.2h10]
MHRRRSVFHLLKNSRSAASAARTKPVAQQAAVPDAAFDLEPSISQRVPHSTLRPALSPASPTPLVSRASSGALPCRGSSSSPPASTWLRPSSRQSQTPDLSRSPESLKSFQPPSGRPQLSISRGSARSLPPHQRTPPSSSFIRDPVPHAGLERSSSSVRRLFPESFCPTSPQSSPHRSTQTPDIISTISHERAGVDPTSETGKGLDSIDELHSPRDSTGDNKRYSKTAFKERRSLRSGDSFIPAYSKGKTTNHWRELAHKKENDKKKKRALETKQAKIDLYIPTTVSVGQLAKLLNVRLRTLQRKMEEAGMQAEMSYDYVLTSDYAALLAEEFGRHPIINDEAAFDLYPPSPHPNPQTLPSRPPIVTIMGHVDHGKTTLLDTLRSSTVAASEAGGITQHIGAFCVPVKTGSDSESTIEGHERLITFLDTPGHAAFSAMRARGTSVTDIVVLVVAADDGVMPQTLEVVELVRREKERGKIGMVVAINKVDKPEADAEKTKLALLAAGVLLEEHGGDVPCIEVSGLTGKGLADLVETLAVMADVMDLRAEQDCPTVGCVLESRIHKGLGPVATVLVTRGTLTPGTPLLAGTSSCSTRRLLSSSAHPLNSVGPGTPVLVTGWKSLPSAGDEVLASSEADIKRARANRQRKRELESVIGGVEAINAARKADKEKEGKERTLAKLKKARSEQLEGEGKCVVPEEVEKTNLRVIVKGDVSGSVEALMGAIEGIGNHLAGVTIVSSGVGDVSDSDVMMAKAAQAIIIAFSVSVPRSVQASASQDHVPIYSSDIIYRVMDDIQDRVISLLPCTYQTKVTGEATVLQLFDIHMKGKLTKKIAGCRVTNGIVERSSAARVMREGNVIHEGLLDALKQMKKDMTEVKKGSECGINLHDFDDLREGDLIQMFKTIEIPGVL